MKDKELMSIFTPKEQPASAVEIKAVKCSDGRWRGYLYAPVVPSPPTAEDWGIQETGPGFKSLRKMLRYLSEPGRAPQTLIDLIVPAGMELGGNVYVDKEEE